MDSRQRKSLTFIIVDYLITECTCESDRDRNSVRVSHWREDKKRSKTIPRMERFSPLRLVWAEVIVKHDWACSNLARRLKKRSTIFKPGRFCFKRLRGGGEGEDPVLPPKLHTIIYLSFYNFLAQLDWINDVIWSHIVEFICRIQISLKVDAKWKILK